MQKRVSVCTEAAVGTYRNLVFRLKLMRKSISVDKMSTYRRWLLLNTHAKMTFGMYRSRCEHLPKPCFSLKADAKTDPGRYQHHFSMTRIEIPPNRPRNLVPLGRLVFWSAMEIGRAIFAIRACFFSETHGSRRGYGLELFSQCSLSPT